MSVPLVALWQSDSAFPSGTFAFSNGLEGLANVGMPADAEGLAELLRQVLSLRWATADRVALARAHRVGSRDLAAVGEIDAEVEAATLAAPLREGSRRNGATFLLAHERIGTPGSSELRASCRDGLCLGHLAVMQGVVFRALGLDLANAIAVAGYAAAAALVTATVRLGSVGAIEGQRALAAVIPLLATFVDEPPAQSDEIASFVPMLDIAACRHAQAHVRLFAN